MVSSGRPRKHLLFFCLSIGNFLFWYGCLTFLEALCKGDISHEEKQFSPQFLGCSKLRVIETKCVVLLYVVLQSHNITMYIFQKAKQKNNS